MKTHPAVLQAAFWLIHFNQPAFLTTNRAW